jgi:hypothetical protein
MIGLAPHGAATITLPNHDRQATAHQLFSRQKSFFAQSHRIGEFEVNGQSLTIAA